MLDEVAKLSTSSGLDKRRDKFQMDKILWSEFIKNITHRIVKATEYLLVSS